MGNLCGSSSSLANPDRVDLTHFDLMKVVGKGGFGKVNAIQRKSNGEILALKRMAKCEVIRKESHIRMVWIERNIMAKFNNSQFLLPLSHAFQSDTELFFIMPFMRGGDLRYHLKTRGTMSEDVAKFYVAEIICGLDEMHRRNIVYRDLKPENILLDLEGHCRISDYGLAVELNTVPDGHIRGSAGTAGYLAPEAVAGEYYTTTPDAFALGVVMYELIHGKRPFRHRTADARGLRHIRWSNSVSVSAKNLIKGFLSLDPQTRFGSPQTGGWAAVKTHSFFNGVDWNAVMAKTLNAPIKPDPNQANCSNQADLADQLIDLKPQPIKSEFQAYFDGFEFNIRVGREITIVINEEANVKPRDADGKEIDLHLSTNTPQPSSPTPMSEAVGAEGDGKDNDDNEREYSQSPSRSVSRSASFGVDHSGMNADVNTGVPPNKSDDANNTSQPNLLTNPVTSTGRHSRDEGRKQKNNEGFLAAPRVRTDSSH